MTRRRSNGAGQAPAVESPPPHSVAAEESLLGGLLIDTSAWHKVADMVRLEDFYRPDHRLIFTAIAAVAATGAPSDITTVANQLERVGQLEDAGGLAYLGTLARDTPTAANIRAYADIMLQQSRKRELLGVAPLIMRAVADGRDCAEVIAMVRPRLERLESSLPHAKPLAAEAVSSWASRPEPAARDWIIQGLVPARRVTSFLADGGLGKTTIAMQIGVHVAVGRPLYGLDVRGGPVLGIFCEDETEELHRRVSAACAAESLELAEIDRFVAISRDGRDNLLCNFVSDQMQFTDFYRQLDATVAQMRPRVLILDTLADFFAGDYMSTTHARQFVRTALGGLCVRHDCAVLLIAHPSAAGMNSGDGGGFSTAWNNAVRSRLYLRRPKVDDPDAAQNRRILEVRKSNYGPSGVSVPLVWQAGAFVRDPEPIEEANTTRAPKVNTGLAVAVREYFSNHAASGTVVGFHTLFEALQMSGALPKGKYETIRKPLQRVMKELKRANIIVPSQVPRGYRFSGGSGGHSGQSGDSLGTPGTRGHGDIGDTPIRGVSPASPVYVPRPADPSSPKARARTTTDSELSPRDPESAKRSAQDLARTTDLTSLEIAGRLKYPVEQVRSWLGMAPNATP